MLETKTEQFKKKSNDMTVNTLIKTIQSEEINYGDILADKLSDEFALKDWLYDYKKVNTFQTQYKRNDEGRMESYIVESGKVRPTSDGKAQVIYLLKMANKYGSYKLAEIANNVIKMLINDAVNEGHYYAVNPTTGSAFKEVVSLDFNSVLNEYLKLPEDMMKGETLLKFLQYDNISSELNRRDGYIALKLLTTNPWNKGYHPQELKKIVGYIDSRLARMEEQMISLNAVNLDKEIKKILQQIVDGKEVSEIRVNECLSALAECNSETRHNYKAKYNHELNRYFKMFKNYNEKYELLGISRYKAFSDLYYDLEKTYEFINDPQFVDVSRRHDEYMKTLMQYKKIFESVGIQFDKKMTEFKKEITKTFGINPSINTM